MQRALLVVEVVDVFVEEAIVQQSMRPVEPCVMKVVKQHYCQQNV